MKATSFFSGRVARTTAVLFLGAFLMTSCAGKRGVSCPAYKGAKKYYKTATVNDNVLDNERF